MKCDIFWDTRHFKPRDNLTSTCVPHYPPHVKCIFNSSVTGTSSHAALKAALNSSMDPKLSWFLYTRSFSVSPQDT